MTFSRRWLIIFFELLVAALILGFYSWYNRFPLLYADSGTYIKSGFIHFAFPDRPIGYGIFLRHASLAESLWFAMIAQLMLVAGVIRLWLHVYVPKKLSGAFFLTLILALTLLSNISVTASLLIPDVHFALLLLCSMVLLSNKTGKGPRLIAGVLMFLMLPFHNSLPLLMMAVAVIYAGQQLFLKQWRQTWPRIAAAFGIAVFGAITISFSNYVYRDEFIYSAGSHAFMINKLRDSDILIDYLDKNCDSKSYELCQYRDQLMGDFLWDYNNSPFYKMGGWEATREEYNAIITDIFTTPEYLKQLSINAVFTTLSQVFTYDQGVALSHYDGGPDFALRESLEYDLGQFYGSRQQRSELDLRGLNTHNLVALFGFILLAVVMLYQKQREGALFGRDEIAFILLFLLANAAISAAFSGVVDRYNTRILWALALIIMVQALNWLQHSRFSELWRRQE